MAGEKTKKIRVGFFFLLVIALISVGSAILLALRKQNLVVFNAYTVFKNGSGLQAGYSVWLNGVNVGTIDAVEIIGAGQVKIIMTIDTAYHRFLHTDAIAKIGSAGLMGDNLVDIIQSNTTAPLLENGAEIPADQPVDYSKMLKKMLGMGKRFGLISQEFQSVSKQLSKGHGSAGILMHDSKMTQELISTVRTAKKSISRVKKSGI